MIGPYAGGVPLVEVVRSSFVEGRHHGSVVVLDAGGGLAGALGDPYGPIFPRSSNKPMQAAAMIEAGLLLDDPADLALVAASHSGEPSHVDRVRAMLDRAGLTEQALGCPPDLPLSEDARDELLRAGGGRERIYMNCSGKHAGMLLTCQAAGWSIVDYLEPDHPLQVGGRATVAELAGEQVTAVGIDGCGAPVFALSLAGLARAFLACVGSPAGTPPRRVADAMRAHPELASGTGRFDLRLMRAVPGLLTKGGAEAVQALAIEGLGAVAVKIDDGGGRAIGPVVVEALGRLGIANDGLAELARPPVLGGGRPVGHLRAEWGSSR